MSPEIYSVFKSYQFVILEVPWKQMVSYALLRHSNSKEKMLYQFYQLKLFLFKICFWSLTWTKIGLIQPLFGSYKKKKLLVSQDEKFYINLK